MTTRTTTVPTISVPTTTTVPPVGTTPGTVIIEVPPSYTMTTRTTTVPTISVPTTTTVSPVGTTPGTVIIEVPPSYTMTTRTTTVPTISVPTTTTVPPVGTTPGTVIIEVPPNQTMTTRTTTVPTISVPTTTTVPPVGTTPGTVIIEVPPNQTMTTRTTTVPTISVPTTTTVPPVGTTPGTVIIEVPPSYTPSWVTITSSPTTSNPITYTTTATTPVGTTPGTVIIVVPYIPSWVTITSSPTTSNPITYTTTATTPVGTIPGTVIIVVPYIPSWVTITSRPTTPYSHDYTTTVTTPVGTTPGTVVIVPPPLSTTTSVDTNSGPLPPPYTTSDSKTTIVVVPIRSTVTHTTCLQGIPGIVTYTNSYVSNYQTVQIYIPIIYSTHRTYMTYTGNALAISTTSIPMITSNNNCLQVVSIYTKYPSSYVPGCTGSGFTATSKVYGIGVGLNASYYSWVSYRNLAQRSSYASASKPNDVATQIPMSTATGITYLSIPDGAGPWDPTHNYFTNHETIFKMSVFINNFTLTLQGYFYAPLTGTYRVALYADNIVWLLVGGLPSQAFICCTNKYPIKVQTDGWKVKDITTNPIIYYKNYYFTAGSYIPMRLVWSNHESNYGFSMSITLPNGTSTYNFNRLIYGTTSNCM